jgi:hypothetical protein
MPQRAAGRVDSRWTAVYHHDTATGDVYVGMNADITGWCSCKDAFVVKFDTNGRYQWEVGELGKGPGKIARHLRRFVGMTHGCIVLNEVAVGQTPHPVYAWDRDGLWVGRLFDSTSTAGIPEYMYLAGSEACQGQVHTDSKTGEVKFYLNWENEIRVYSVTGWDDWVHGCGIVGADEPDSMWTDRKQPTGNTMKHPAPAEYALPRRVRLNGRVISVPSVTQLIEIYNISGRLVQKLELNGPASPLSRPIQTGECAAAGYLLIRCFDRAGRLVDFTGRKPGMLFSVSP